MKTCGAAATRAAMKRMGASSQKRTNMKTYISGCMRGYKFYNAPAFDEARDRFRALGHEVISPADMDREVGFDPMVEGATVDDNFIKRAIKRDIEALLNCDQIAMLPGWKKSRGATAEYRVALWLGLPVIDAWTLKPVLEDDHV